MSRDQLLQEQASEQTRKHAHRNKETGTARDPFEIGADAATRNDEVHVGMMEQVLPPGVQNAEESDLGSEVPEIAGDGE